MLRYKFSILYYMIFVVPFISFALFNLYVYIFTNIPANPKAIDALLVGVFLGIIGSFVILAEDSL